MHDTMIQDLTERYIQCAYEVWKMGEALVREEIGEQLTTDQLYILRYINQKRRVTSTELADAFRVQKSAITAMVARLVDKGLIHREQDSADRRLIYLQLTEEGKELFHKLQDRVIAITSRFISQFETDELVRFIQTYEKLANILREMR